MPFTETRADISRWSREYDELSNEYRTVCLEAERYRDEYDLAKAHAMLKSPPEYKVDEKKAHVTIICKEEAVKAHTAEASREWHKERLRALAALLNAAQSQAATEREELKLMNFKP